MSNPLQNLLEECVVRVDGNDEFLGTGFFVAPNEVITCAHVVEGLSSVDVSGAGWKATGEVVERDPDPGPDDEVGFELPDLARIEVADAPAGHACVRLDAALPTLSDTIHLRAYTQGEYGSDSVVMSPSTVDYEGPLHIPEGDRSVLKLARGQVLSGYSGSPALNRKVGSVVAVIDSSREEKADLGGFGVPVGMLEETFAGLLERNARFHQGDSRWQNAWSLELEVAAICDAGSLPLRIPFVANDWSPGEPPSNLLRPRYGAVDMVGREKLLDSMLKWREEGEGVKVAIVSGGGGYGKTRLALEECAAADRADWTAGLLMAEDREAAASVLAQIATWPRRLVIAVDYAETRPGVVNGLLDVLLARQDGPTARVILVCRQDMDKRELHKLFGAGGDREQIQRTLSRSELIRLGEGSHAVDRHELFVSAARSLACSLRKQPKKIPSPALDREHYSRPLFVVAAALLWLEDQTLDVDRLDRDKLMLEVLERHESQYWEHWNVESKLGLDEDMQRRAVAVAAALGAGSEDEALALVASVPGLESFAPEMQRQIAIWLSKLYGSGPLTEPPAIAPLEPDSLAEVLITNEYKASPELLARSVATASGLQRERFLTMVTRASETEGKAAPAEFAIEVFESAAGKYGGGGTGGPERREALAKALRNFSDVLRHIGRVEKAVPPARQAVDHYRALADADGARYRRALGGELNDFATLLAEAGDNQGALVAIQEAVAYLEEGVDGSG